MKKYVVNGAALTIAMSVVVGGCGICFLNRILTAMNTPRELYHHAYVYMGGLLMVLPLSSVSGFLSTVVRMLGHAKMTVTITVFSLFQSVLLSVFFLLILRLGLAGLALQSLVGALTGMAFTLVNLKKKTQILDFERGEWKLDLSAMRSLLKIGLPMGITIVLISSGQLVLQTAANGLGREASIALSSSDALWGLLFTPITALCYALSAFSGQNYGAGKVRRLGSGLKFSLIVAGAWCVILFLATNVCKINFAALYLKPEETLAREYLSRCMSFFAVMYICLAALYVFKYAIEGMGYGKFAVWQGVGEISARLFASAVLIPVLGFTGVILAGPLAWFCGGGMLVLVYWHIYRKVLVPLSRERDLKAVVEDTNEKRRKGGQ